MFQFLIVNCSSRIIVFHSSTQLQQDEFNSAEVMNYLNNQFAGHNFNDYSELVLGCTHFNYFKDSFARTPFFISIFFKLLDTPILPSIISISSGNSFANESLK